MDQYGSDFITIVDEDGTEYELEVLMELEYNGQKYLAVVLADRDEDEVPEVNILKDTVEDGEPMLVAILDQEELEAVNSIMMEKLYEDSEEM